MPPEEVNGVAVNRFTRQRKNPERLKRFINNACCVVAGERLRASFDGELPDPTSLAAATQDRLDVILSHWLAGDTTDSQTLSNIVVLRHSIEGQAFSPRQRPIHTLLCAVLLYAEEVVSTPEYGEDIDDSGTPDAAKPVQLRLVHG